MSKYLLLYALYDLENYKGHRWLEFEAKNEADAEKIARKMLKKTPQTLAMTRLGIEYLIYDVNLRVVGPKLLEGK